MARPRLVHGGSMSYAAWLARLLIAGVFVAFLAGKARNRRAFSAFAGSVRELAGVPVAAARPLAVATVAAGFCVTAAVLAPVAARYGLAGAFTVVLLAALCRRRAQRLPCRSVADRRARSAVS
ncbi:MauE/DoxX family redox-associated membrane protein [Dactylosporangium sp. NPDC000555]|uniref:MauE/DoxX family redox-associated membrane protein n=1 Tax=Dactylosporangium sp. NPDC000555 TaxID=3154260 RepID=UPI003326777F